MKILKLFVKFLKIFFAVASIFIIVLPLTYSKDELKEIERFKDERLKYHSSDDLKSSIDYDTVVLPKSLIDCKIKSSIIKVDSDKTFLLKSTSWTTLESPTFNRRTTINEYIINTFLSYATYDIRLPINKEKVDKIKEDIGYLHLKTEHYYDTMNTNFDILVSECKERNDCTISNLSKDLICNVKIMINYEDNNLNDILMKQIFHNLKKKYTSIDRLAYRLSNNEFFSFIAVMYLIWFIISIVRINLMHKTPPKVTPIIATSNIPPEIEEQFSEPTVFYVNCINCNTKYENPSSSLCANCGKSLYEKDNSIKCKSCGGEYDPEETNCPICGI